MSGLGLSADLNAKEWQAALAVFAPAVYRQASAQTLNAIAKQVDTAERENLRKSFTLRNKYTEGSLRLYTASEKKDIASQNAVVGSVSAYLPLHDTGGSRTPTGRAIALPTLAARGNSPARAVKKQFRLDSLSAPAFSMETRRGGAGLFVRKGKKLTMIRRLVESVRIKKTGWHSGAVQKYARKDVLEKLFRKKAERLLDKLR